MHNLKHTTDSQIQQNNLDLDPTELNVDEELIMEEEFDIMTISDSDEPDSTSTDNDLNIMFNFNTNKHKREGKHALKTDSIFNGKSNKDALDEYDTSESKSNIKYNIEVGSVFEFESKNNEEYVNQKQLSIDVLEVLTEFTDIDFTSNRRKPNRIIFNQYFLLLVSKLHLKYTNSELFVELSYFFTDNIFNMFKLLDKKQATIIIKELKAKGYLKDLDNMNFI